MCLGWLVVLFIIILAGFNKSYMPLTDNVSSSRLFLYSIVTLLSDVMR